jgi:hypothetical protein
MPGSTLQISPAVTLRWTQPSVACAVSSSLCEVAEQAYLWALLGGDIRHSEAGDHRGDTAARLGGLIMSSSHTAGPSLIPDIEAFEERAAIAQYDGGVEFCEELTHFSEPP